ncbi:helix-turn-helix transcriptional regulator [Vagococcus sp. BWB3-3]|uniref:Helix-turn-helix transcriptional regulator n=1 Tax=Vagococcus allomyrinae TaxID=2794353 RepID=A0A940PE36_9ENTE|nr:helix-turn-helix transcriptional regulator [Vagococcus allomyrinae]MBP1042902.1 helix-turn-helix transcriptional regulator [Vagococcus allomyrinae]
MNFAKQLKKYREVSGLSQTDLAEKIYVTRQTISKWEKGKTYPDIQALIALSKLFDISLDELIKGINYEKEETMVNTAWLISYKLKDGVSNEDFIKATQKLHDNCVSKADGFLFWEQYLDKDTWTDFVMWETQEDARNGVHAGTGREESGKFYSMIQMETCTTKMASSFVKRY